MKLYNNHDGKIGVVVSPSYGIGWFTQNGEEYPDCATDPDLIYMVLEYCNLCDSDEYSYSDIHSHPRHADFINAEKRISEYANKKWPTGYWDARGLVVEWVPKGSIVKFDNYDGSESMSWSDIDRSTTLVIPLE